MKKILSIFTIILMLASFSVSAAVDSTASYRYDSVNNGFYVFGTVNDTKIGDDITIEAYFNDVLFDVTMTETFLKDGKAYFESDFIAISTSKPSGMIKFKVYSANNVLTCETDSFSYYGLNDNFSVLKAVVAEMTEGDFNGLKNVLVFKASDTAPYNYELLGVDYSLVSSLSQKAGEMVGKYAETVSIDVPENIDTDQNKDLAFEKLVEFKKAYYNMGLIGNFVDISSEDEFKSWYTAYGETLDLKTYNNAWFTYFNDTYQKDDFYSVLSMENQAMSDINKIKDRLLEVGGLTSVKRGNAASVKTVVEEFNSLMSIIYKLNDVQKSSVYSQLAGNAFGSFDSLSAKYNELAYELLNSSTTVTPGGSLGGGGSVGGGSSSGGNVTISPVIGNTTSNKVVFSDMASAKWAEKAVNYLYEKGIVSGKTKTEFYPNDNVTRAEFVKLLVMASGETLDANTKVFADVNESDWYFAYVNKAYAMGLVKGNEKGNFNPNAQITREDMATMIYRLIGNDENKGDVNVFTDAVNISDYAKNAVSYLYVSNIINGMGDGSFAPKSMATRAQAAQIIYNIVK